MQNRSAILVMLLIAALFGIGFFYFNQDLNQGLPGTASTPGQEKAAPAFWKKSKGATALTNQPAVVFKTNRFRWNQIESADYREYITNLRGVGCPESTIRDIIITDIMRLYAVRRGQFYHNAREFKFWETDEKRKLKAKQLEEREKQLASIDKEIPGVLRDLLGINYERELNKYFVDTDDDKRRLSFLSEGKRDSVLALRDEIEGMREKISEQAKDGKLSPQQLAEMKKIDEYRRKKLGQLLSPIELDQFDLNTSETADQLRKNLTGFNPSEEEFREMYRLFKAHDDKYGLAGESNEALQQEKTADEQRMEEEILSKLSPDRAQDFLRAKNEEFRNLWVFTEAYELPPSTAQSLFEIRQAVKEEQQALLSADLSEDARAQGMKAIQDETEKTVRKLIGEQAYGKFVQSSGSWIPKLSPN
ncbi:MAG: hypothetical protein JWM68_3256 [Verrucomicrobiales bacterium]|nr:hypothetical protein [Verrucomicrobiales bacterium]